LNGEIKMLDDQYPLVGGIPTPLKNMSSSIGMIIPNIWKKRKRFQTTNQIIADGYQNLG